MLGVTPPPPLRQLSTLWGIAVLDVQRYDGGGHRIWRVVVERGPHGRVELPPVTSRQLRSASELGWLLRWWGRSESLPLPTKADARRSLRLLHEHVEQAPTT